MLQVIMIMLINRKGDYMVQSQVKSKEIFVHNKDLGFWTQTPITAQRFELVDGELELVWCNHAGSESEEIESSIINPNGADHVWYTMIEVCDKCDAIKRPGDNYWEDAPIEGVTE